MNLSLIPEAKDQKAKKVKTVLSAEKVRATVLWHSHDIIDCLEKGKIITEV